MRKAQILSGEELVAKGATKNEALLPEAGVKDVLPNGSWLEQKQIQAAVEARKHLIEVERIEKCGVLSHADWLEDVCLARVTQQAGSYWQHLGHHNNKQLFLYPEEALYLMEVNCLQLQYNKVTVSLQQAYSLLLRGTITVFQYKVYSSLSRIGYKVFRHHIPNKIPADEARDKCTEVTNDKKEVKIEDVKEMSVNYVLVPKENHPTDDNLQDMHVTESDRDTCQEKDEQQEDESKKESTTVQNIDASEVKMTVNCDVEQQEDENCASINGVNSDENRNNKDIPSCSNEEVNIAKPSIPSHENDEQQEDESKKESTTVQNNDASEVKMTVNCDVEQQEDEYRPSTSGANSDENRNNKDIPSCSNEEENIAKPSTSNVQIETQKPLSAKETIIQKLIKRKTKSLSKRKLEKHFENVPDCLKTIVTVQVPDETYLPRNVFLNNTAYVINMDDVKQSGPRQAQASTRTYSVSDEPSSSLVRRIRRTSSSNSAPQTGMFPTWSDPHRYIPNRFPQQPWFRAPQYPNLASTAMFNFIFQRHFAPQINFPRFQFQNRPQAFRFQLRPGFNSQNGSREHRKRRAETEQKEHLQTIKSLAFRLKNLALLRSPNFGQQNTQALQHLINTYNSTYKASIRLDHNFDIIEQENIVETINLEDDGPTEKKPRESSDTSAYEEKLKRVKQLATRLKDLTEQGKAFARHRRAFSNMMMNFNKSFNADVYLGMNFEIIDRRHIVLDSSSEDDCVIDDKPKKSKKQVGKKLRNPFSVMNQFCLVNPSPSRRPNSLETNDMSRNFKSWIPKDDFGKPAIMSKEAGELELIVASKAEYLYDFVRRYNTTFESWAEIKMSFWDSFEDGLALQEETSIENDVSSNCLVTAEDCRDMATVLQKLRIIETCTTTNEGSNLSVDFDVYNRDVQNFRKSNRPVPHFRILCMKDSDPLPSGGDLESLYSHYKDQVPIIVAVVGVGSISYVQLRTTQVPVFIPTHQAT